MKSFIFCFFAISLLLGCTPSTETSIDSSPNADLIGAWTWDHSTFNNQDTSFVWNDVFGQIMFTDKAYSLIRIWKNGARDTITLMPGKNPFETFTNDKLNQIIGPVTANSGEYRVEGDSIIITTKVSLWPNPMAAGAAGITPKSAMPVISNDTMTFKSGNWNNIYIRMK